MPIDRRQRKLLVAGATGRLGVLVEILLACRHSVRAITRQIQSPPADRLRGIGAEVVYGNFNDPDGIARAAAGGRRGVPACFPARYRSTFRSSSTHRRRRSLPSAASSALPDLPQHTLRTTWIRRPLDGASPQTPANHSSWPSPSDRPGALLLPEPGVAPYEQAPSVSDRGLPLGPGDPTASALDAAVRVLMLRSALPVTSYAGLRGTPLRLVRVEWSASRRR
jgi:hypothetical protein